MEYLSKSVSSVVVVYFHYSIVNVNSHHYGITQKSYFERFRNTFWKATGQ